ncbi:MAG: hypothetical protein AAF652_20095, partial [Cyanobacteria bacterium P01_C01_bin.72]
FHCSFSISKGGASIKEKPNKITLDRDFNNTPFNQMKIKDNLNVSALKGIYFHRIAELVDLSRIFASLAQSLVAQSEEELKLGKAFLTNDSQDGVLSKIPESFCRFADGQTLYNIHLKRKLERAAEHLRSQYLNKITSTSSAMEIIELRDRRVRMIFGLLRE